MIDAGFEDKVLACLLKSGEFCQAASRDLKPSYFSSAVKHNIAKMSIDFWERYKSKLSMLGFTELMKDLVADKKISDKDIGIYVAEYKRLLTIDVSDWQFVLERLIIFIRDRETRAFIEACVTRHLPKNDFDSIYKAMRDVSAIGTTVDVAPYDYLSADKIIERSKRREIDHACKSYGISTGIKRMDDVFPKKGWYRRELYTILAPPKRGKTMAMQWFANAALLQGFTAVIFTLETSTEVYCDRLDSMNSNIETKHLPEHYRDVATKLASLRPEGRLFIYEYPTKRCTPDEIERQLRRLEVEKGITADILFVDYADIMRPNRFYNDVLREQASIYEDLRALACVFDIPVVTASQVNRTGSDKSIITGKDSAGTWDKIMVSDAVISLSATDAELKKGEMKIHFAECRNMESATIRIKTAYNFGRFYKEFVEEAA